MDIPKYRDDTNDNNVDNHLDNLNENNSGDRNTKKENVIGKRCPFCKTINKKDYKSNLIQCKNCRKYWCYLCRKKYNIDHYSIFGGCPFLEYTECCFANNCFFLFMYRLLFPIIRTLLLALLIPIFFPIAFPALLIYFSTFDIEKADHKFTIGDIFFCLFWGISFSPIPFAIGCLGSVITLFYWPFPKKLIHFFGM